MPSVSRWRQLYQIKPKLSSWQDIVRGKLENTFIYLFIFVKVNQSRNN